jgi:transposase
VARLAGAQDLLQKKALRAGEQDRPDLRARRAEWVLWRAGLDPDRLVFLDETWVKSNMTPSYGWGPTHQRVVEGVPHGHWKTITFIAALRSTGLFAPVVVDGAMNGEVFRAYVRQHLAPQLRPGDRVVMDNLPSHKVAGVVEAVRAVGAEVVYLPPYSPDLNPIEQVFAKAKSEIRKRKSRTIAQTEKLCGEALEWFTAHECENYIHHAGYGPQRSD